MDNLKRFKGQYLKDDEKHKKIKPKGNELQSIGLCVYSHNGKKPNHGGAI
jgi:hypothetical protein